MRNRKSQAYKSSFKKIQKQTNEHNYIKYTLTNCKLKINLKKIHFRTSWYPHKRQQTKGIETSHYFSYCASSLKGPEKGNVLIQFKYFKIGTI